METKGRWFMAFWLAAFVWPADTQAQYSSRTNPSAGVLNFAQANLGRQVGNGECWTLAFDALRAAGARHDQAHRYIFGQPVTGQMMPGDILQFENCLFQGSNYRMQMAHHTAIIHSMESPGVYRILHQNVGGNRRVQFGRINTGDLRRGTLAAYRPVAISPSNNIQAAGFNSQSRYNSGSNNSRFKTQGVNAGKTIRANGSLNNGYNRGVAVPGGSANGWRINISPGLRGTRPEPQSSARYLRINLR